MLSIMDFTTDGPYEETKRKQSKFENYIYLQIDDKILKLCITVDDKLLKKHMETLVSNLDEVMFDIVSEEEMKNCCFPIKMEYVGKFRLQERRKTKNYKIPAVDIDECSLIYVLNSMYDNNGLTKEDLYNLCYEKENNKENSCKRNIVEDVIYNLLITVVEEYDYDKLKDSVEYVSYVTNQENLWQKINLKNLKNVLSESQKNIETFRNLDLYNPNEYIYPIKKQKKLRK